jgi:phage head maturation protease
MEKKTVHVEIKNEAEGVVRARFATLGVKDLDGDVTEKGAFGEQRVKVSAFNHSSWGHGLPVGIGEISEKGDEAIAELRFFMDTTHGRDHFETVKGLGELGEWSYGFDVAESRQPDEDERQKGIRRVLKQVKVFEVSPVLRGAGVATATLGVKCDACAAKAELEEGAQEGVDKSAADPPELRAEIEAEVRRARELLERASEV